MFDTFIMVDWSAANMPRLGRDSIWVCRHDADGETLVNPATRHAAKALLGDWLATALESDRRVLLGFDFPFGYPAGFADRLGLPGTPWRAVWDEIAGLLQDDEHNRNNRFDVAEALNRRISGGGFPFWGCPKAPARVHLQGKHHRRHGSDGLAERRLVDLYIPSAQPCWKLLGAGSVGGQALTGIPVARALRDDSRWRRDTQVWPFETGLCAQQPARVVMAEVYPSLWAVKPEADETKDAAQVRAVARFLHARDRVGELAGLFAGDPGVTAAQRGQIEREEAWTLGVTVARQRPIPVAEERRRREKKRPSHAYAYLREPAAISRKSFALVRAEANLARFPRPLRRVAARIAHAAGDTAMLDDLAWSAKAVAAAQAALTAGAPILVDSTMVEAGIIRERLPGANETLCFLRDPAVAGLAAAQRTTRSAAAVELWRPYLAGAVVAIGNAPTALFRLLEILVEGAPKPAVILGFPVGFVGAAEAKSALAAFGRGVEFITLHGRRGGSAIAAAAVNAFASLR
jgi:precorrin-8X/cobalt-precorrin-8 methylmutase